MKDVGFADREIETSGLGETSTFSIASSPKAFRLLIAGLYSDKPRAITRELWSNAFDSHVMAGIPDRPFTVHLPTAWELEFSVRDYGVSLTHDQVLHLYTTVFKSTKEDTNTQVGKFGLGSKTPFAYTDSYTTTAILDGEKRIYNAYINEKGIPVCSLLMREPTDEENGLMVSFPVHAKDVADFREAARRVMDGFDVLPEINLTDYEAPVAKLSGNGWNIYGVTRAIGALHIRQGCVLYPVDPSALDPMGKMPAVKHLANVPMIIDMPVGTVDITPDREKLSYDDKTKANIIQRLDVIVNEMCAEVFAKVEAAKTPYEASLIVLQDTTLSAVSGLRELVKKSAKWNGKPVSVAKATWTVDHTKVSLLAKSGLELFHIKKNRRSSGAYRVDRSDGWRTVDPWVWNYRISSDYDGWNYKPVPINIFYHKDEKCPSSKKISRIMEHVGDYYSSDTNLNLWAGYLDLECVGITMLKDYLGGKEDINYIDVDGIDLSEYGPTKEERSKPTPVHFRYMEANVRKEFGLVSEACLPSWDTNRPVYYIRIANDKAIVDDRKMEKETFSNFINACLSEGILAKNFYIIGVPKTHEAKIANFPKRWIDLEDEMMGLVGEYNAEHIQPYIDHEMEYNRYDEKGDDKRIIQMIMDYGSADKSSWYYIKAKMQIEKIEAVDYGRTLSKVTNPIIAHIRSPWILDAIWRERGKLNTRGNGFKPMRGDFNVRYPLLRLMTARDLGTRDGQHLVEYFELIDAKRASTETKDVQTA